MTLLLSVHLILLRYCSLEDNKPRVTPLEKPQTENLSKEPLSELDEESELDELLERLESVLVFRLPAEKSKKFVDQLEACSNEEELREKALAISKKVTLLVNASVGKDLLAILDY